MIGTYLFLLPHGGVLVAGASSPTSSVAGDDTLTQVSALLRGIAPILWPLIVVLAIVIFRGPLGSAFGRISEVDIGSNKVLLQQQADMAANTTKAVSGAAASGARISTTPSPAMSSARDSAGSDPAGAVLKAWSAVEDAVRPIAVAAAGVISPTVRDAVNSLISKGLDSSLVPTSASMSALRDVAARKPKSITPATATSFVAAADDLVRLIRAHA
ncbi:MAG TPA: hypothetical protein VIM17_04990 [Jatrophihabitantaceae bacterium]